MIVISWWHFVEWFIILQDCHCVLWRTDAKIFCADEAHLNLRNRERKEPRVIRHMQCLWFLNKHRSTDQPDETNVKKIQSVCVCVWRVEEGLMRVHFCFHLSCLRASQLEERSAESPFSFNLHSQFMLRWSIMHINQKHTHTNAYIKDKINNIKQSYKYVD